MSTTMHTLAPLYEDSREGSLREQQPFDCNYQHYYTIQSTNNSESTSDFGDYIDYADGIDDSSSYTATTPAIVFSQHQLPTKVDSTSRRLSAHLLNSQRSAAAASASAIVAYSGVGRGGGGGGSTTGSAASTPTAATASTAAVMARLAKDEVTASECADIDSPSIHNLFVVPDCPLHWVTVFRDKAELCRLVRPRLAAGQLTQILFTRLSPFVDKDSIRVEVRGPAVIQDVSYRTRRLDADEQRQVEGVATARRHLRQEHRLLESMLLKKSRLEKQRIVLETFADTLIGPSSNVAMVEKISAGGTNPPSAAAAVPPPSSGADRYNPQHMDTMRGFFNLYEDQADKLDVAIMKLRDDMEAAEGRIRDLERELKELELRQDEHITRELTVLVEASEAGQLDVYLSYIVSNARWTPSYDVRIFNNDGTLKVVYYGLIQQSTGEDWESSQLRLSTALPGVGGTVPDLGIQKMQFRSSKNAAAVGASGASGSAVSLSKSKSFSRNAARSSKGRSSTVLASPSSPAPPGSPSLTQLSVDINDAVAANQVTASIESPFTWSTLRNSSYATGGLLLAPPESPSGSLLRPRVPEDQLARDAAGSPLLGPRRQPDHSTPSAGTHFEVPRPPACIPCDNEPHRVTVAFIDLQPTFEYISAPKKAPFAYLKANMQNLSKFALLPGGCNIYVDNNFVGKSEIGAVAPQEEFSCKLGADHGIKINYNPMYKYKEVSGSSGKHTVYTFKQVIEVKNCHERAVKLLLLDQLPVSGEDKIKVTLLEPVIKHPEKYDKSKPIRINKCNIVEWDLDLPPGEHKELVLKYSIEHPSTEEVAFFDS